MRRPQRTVALHHAVPSDVPARARQRAMQQRKAQPVTVRVERRSLASLRGQHGSDRVPSSIGAGIELAVVLAPVLADAEAQEAGLVLSGQPLAVVVPDRAERSSLYVLGGDRRVLWAAGSTVELMGPEDWKWVARSELGRPVPVVPSSHLRCLAYYSALERQPGEHGHETLARWGKALGAVQAGIEAVEAMYGSPLNVPVSDDVLDLTFEQALASKSKATILSWATAAKSVAKAATRARSRAAEAWMALPPEPRTTQETISRTIQSTAAAAARAQSVYLAGGFQGLSPGAIYVDELGDDFPM